MQPAHTFKWQKPFNNDRFRILFVDDNLFAIKSVRNILEKAGYSVFTAQTREDALNILEATHIHLGIFDLNLAGNVDADNQPDNFDGLELAQNPEFPFLRMVYSGKDDHEIIIGTLEHPQVVNYIVKGEDDTVELLQKVASALSERLPLNQDLFLHWDDVALQQIVQTVYPQLALAHQIEHIKELDDLFRIQFFGVGQDMFKQVSISALSAKRSERIWLQVSGYTKRGRRYDHLVLCGKPDVVTDEAEQFDKLSPLSNQMRTPPIRTVHYGLHAYEVYDDNLHTINTLTHFLATGHDDLVHDVLDTVHTNRFQRRYRQASNDASATLYQLALGSDETVSWETCESLFGVVNRIIEEWQHLMPHIQLDIDQSNIVCGVGRDQKIYPHPLIHFEKISNREATRPIGKVFGDLRLDTIFAQADTHDLFLFDYADVKQASLLRDYVTLERSLHLELLSQIDIEDYTALTEALNNPDQVDLDTLSDAIKRALIHIDHIRQLAFRDLRCSLADYLLDLYIDFVNYLASYPNRSFVGYQTVRRYAHCFLFAGQVCADLKTMGVITLEEYINDDGLYLDANGHRIRKSGRTISLTEQQFSIFAFLYENFDKECTYADIIEKGLREEFIEDNLKLEKPRIQTAVSRLRPELKDIGFKIASWRNGYRLQHRNLADD